MTGVGISRFGDMTENFLVAGGSAVPFTEVHSW